MIKIKTLVAGLIMSGALVSSVASATAANAYSQRTSKAKFGVEAAISRDFAIATNIFMNYKHIEVGAGMLFSIKKTSSPSPSERATTTALSPQVYIGYRFDLSKKIYASTGLTGTVFSIKYPSKADEGVRYSLSSYASLGYHITKHFDFFTNLSLLSYKLSLISAEISLVKTHTRTAKVDLLNAVDAGICYTF